jgi:Protein tyrosine and serine/threonine kinase
MVFLYYSFHFTTNKIQFINKSQQEKADVYSFGVVLWELIFRKKPWQGKHSMKVIQMVESGGRLPLANMPADVPQQVSLLNIYIFLFFLFFYFYFSYFLYFFLFLFLFYIIIFSPSFFFFHHN